jgi:hypothetical protein
MTLSELKSYIQDQLVAPVTLVIKIINVFNAVVDFFTGNSVTDIIPAWTSLLTFQTDDTDAGRFCIYPDDNGKKRIFETKTDDNINNPPPSDPNLTENTYWIEISQAGSSAIVEWEAKLYGAGLVIVFWNNSLYKLVEADRPFSSANIEDEIVAGQWLLIARNSYRGPWDASGNTFPPDPQDGDEWYISNVGGGTLDNGDGDGPQLYPKKTIIKRLGGEWRLI